MGGKPRRKELTQEPHAPGLARLALGQQPECAVGVRLGPGHSRQDGIAISDEAGNDRHAHALPHRRELSIEV